MLRICLVFWESEPQYAYKHYAYKKKHVVQGDVGDSHAISITIFFPRYCHIMKKVSLNEEIL